MPVMMAGSHRDLEIHRYPAPLYLIVIVAALVLQAMLPRAVGPSHVWFDFPLVVTIYFALGRRSPIQGMFIGSFVGIFEDALTHHAIGINGIAKTVAGYLAASVGKRIDVQNYLVRVAAQLRPHLVLQCALPLHLPGHAGHGAGVELAHQPAAGDRQLAYRARFLPHSGPLPIEGLMPMNVRAGREERYFLKTARLGFRAWRKDDLPLAMALWTDVRVTGFFGGPYSPQQVQARLAREMADQRESGMQYWPFFLLEDGRHVGVCGLRPWKPGVPELGFHLRPEFWRLGLAFEAATAVIRYGFDQFGRIHALRRPSSGKCGFPQVTAQARVPVRRRGRLSGKRHAGANLPARES